MKCCSICKNPLTGADRITHSDYCWECGNSKNPHTKASVDSIEQGYKTRAAKLTLEATKTLWKYENLPRTRITYRVYYIDYGGDKMSYYTDPIHSIPEARDVLAHKKANGVDVVAMIVEEKTSYRNINS